jgi:hypothetical protein
MTYEEALRFVERHGIVLQAARGPLPSLAEEIAGGRIRGSWWSHAKARDIYRVLEAVSESSDVLVCRLVDRKITYVHRRLWPALVKLASRFRKDQLAKVWNEHTSSGKHRARKQLFPAWVPADVLSQANEMPLAKAEEILEQWLIFGKGGAKPRKGRQEKSDR